MFSVCLLANNNVYAFNLYHSKTLPYISKNFVGREEEVKKVMRIIDFRNNSESDIRIVNIIGPPGFGKSTLAIHIGHEMVRKGVVVYYLNVAEFSDKAVKIALAEKVLDNSDIVVCKQVTFERLLRWARECFLNTLLILDNCDDVLNNHGEGFHDAIMKVVEESLNIKVLMTSRRVATFTKYYKWFEVEELATAAACELLDHKIPTTIEINHEEKEQIANLIGNVPLALQIIGSLLHLPDPPSLNTIIRQLNEELILTLSSEELPSYEQVNATISISYKFLSKELQEGSHYLTIFPGSFSRDAVLAIFSHSSDNNIIGINDHVWENREPMKTLVRRSLLQRDDRYRYHILIKEYLLFIQGRVGSNTVAKFLPTFHIYYAQQLVIASSKFQNDPDSAIAILDLEHHNIQYIMLAHMGNVRLAEGCSTQLIEAFLETASAVTRGIDTGLMKLHFSATTLCDSVEHIVVKLDKMVHKLEHYLWQQSFTQEITLHIYLQLINQLAACKEENGVRAAARIYTIRKCKIEFIRDLIETKKYVDFYMKLSGYLHQLGQERKVVECHRLIIQRTRADLADCKPNECNHYDIGEAYYKMDRYEDAAKFFEMALAKINNSMSKVRALIKLENCYAKLEENNMHATTNEKLSGLYFDIKNALLEFPEPIIVGANFMQTIIIDLSEFDGFRNRAVPSIIDLKFEYGSDSEQYSRYKLVNVALRFIHYLEETGNFTEVIKFGDILMNSIKSPNRFLTIELSLLVGKAKMFEGNFFDGMDEIEYALQAILERPATEYTEAQKALACSLLIPRLVYIETCYQVRTRVRTTLANAVHSAVISLIYFLFSPYPFSVAAPAGNRESTPPSSRTTNNINDLETIGGPLSVLNPLWLFQYKQQQWLTQTVTESVDVIMKMYNEITEFLAPLRKLMNVCLCTLTVWTKLMLYYALCLNRRQRWNLYVTIGFFCLDVFVEIFLCIFAIAVFIAITRNLSIIRAIIRKMRDPRFLYVKDGMFYTQLIDSDLI